MQIYTRMQYLGTYLFIVHGEYIAWLKQFKLWKVNTLVESIVVVGVLTCCTLRHFMCDLKAAQMKMPHSLIQELMVYKLELGQ